MKNPQRYRNNLISAHQLFSQLFIVALVPLFLLTVGTVFWAYRQYAAAAEQAYVFHQGGASIEIFTPKGHQITPEYQQAKRNIKNRKDL